MTALSFSCPLCGHTFDPAANAGCATCPLSGGCRIVCCPNCGHSTVDPRSSRLARWAEAALRRLAGRRSERALAPQREPAGATALMVAPRGPARVAAVMPGAADAEGRLRAYGIAPGALLEVLQQRPETVVRIERTELALEAELAALVLVELV
jgi:Fe2+ transport system protein FeoA